MRPGTEEPVDAVFGCSGCWCERPGSTMAWGESDRGATRRAPSPAPACLLPPEPFGGLDGASSQECWSRGWSSSSLTRQGGLLYCDDSSCSRCSREVLWLMACRASGPMNAVGMACTVTSLRCGVALVAGVAGAAVTVTVVALTAALAAAAFSMAFLGFVVSVAARAFVGGMLLLRGLGARGGEGAVAVWWWAGCVWSGVNGVRMLTGPSAKRSRGCNSIKDVRGFYDCVTHNYECACEVRITQHTAQSRHGTLQMACC